MKGLSKGRYDETFSGEDAVSVAGPIGAQLKVLFSSDYL